jgi:hypothetical protein
MTTKQRVLGLFLAALGAVLTVGGDAHAIIGRPLTPFSYAGVARRTVRRSAYYGYGYGAAAPYAAPANYVPAVPAGCAPGVPCGGAVYNPYYYGGSVVYGP